MTDKTPRRFLISRLSAIGDCILTMPMAHALRQHFPQASIVWAVEPAGNPLVSRHTCVDETIVVRKGWLKRPGEVAALRRRLRQLQIDVALDPQSLTKSAMLGWLSGAGRRIGLARPHGRELALWLNNERVVPQSGHVVDVFLELLKPLGIEASRARFDVPDDRPSREKVAQFLCDTHLATGFAVLGPGGSWDSKLWPAKNFGQLARRLGQHSNLPSVVIWHGRRERDWAERIVAGSGGHAFLAPDLSLLELAALLRVARLLVAGDTGPLHLAAAVGTACIGLYGPTQPQRCGPYGSQHATVQAYYQSGTRRQRRRASNEAMCAISVDMVLAACQDVLRRPSGIRAALDAA